jgi:hypothetical protein
MSGPTSMMRDGLITLAITAALLTIVNFLMVHFALDVFSQPNFPRAFLKYVDPCYQTIYHDTHGAGFRNWIAVTGDSYAAGSGDEFLDRKRDYGIFPKLRSLTNENYFVFGRGGFGSINAARELTLCMSMFNDSFLLPRIDEPKELLFLFYEGNDLDNNVDHLRLASRGEPVESFVQDQISHPDDEWRRQIALHMPLYDVIWGQLSRLGGPSRDRKKLASQRLRGDAGGGGSDQASRAAGSQDASAAAERIRDNYAIIDRQARPVPRDPQGAAAELTGNLDVPLRVFYESVLALHRGLPRTRISIVYLPSVVTTYSWQDPIRVEAYHTTDAVFTTNRDNAMQSRRIREAIADFAGRHHFGFIDPTARLQAAARTKFIHGPRDWEHFNAVGNWIVADTLARAPRTAMPTAGTPAGTGRP